jgi:hypothetical protein
MQGGNETGEPVSNDRMRQFRLALHSHRDRTLAPRTGLDTE